MVPENNGGLYEEILGETFQTFVEIFRKHPQGFIQINVILQVRKFPGILVDIQEDFQECLRHIRLKGLRVSVATSPLLVEFAVCAQVYFIEPGSSKLPHF